MTITDLENDNTKVTMNIKNREFIVNQGVSQNEVIFQALNRAFEEIDELKNKNKVLNERLNSFMKK